jgi:hypothetical protein
VKQLARSASSLANGSQLNGTKKETDEIGDEKDLLGMISRPLGVSVDQLVKVRLFVLFLDAPEKVLYGAAHGTAEAMTACSTQGENYFFLWSGRIVKFIE